MSSLIDDLDRENKELRATIKEMDNQLEIHRNNDIQSLQDRINELEEENKDLIIDKERLEGIIEDAESNIADIAYDLRNI